MIEDHIPADVYGDCLNDTAESSTVRDDSINLNDTEESDTVHDNMTDNKLKLSTKENFAPDEPRNDTPDSNDTSNQNDR